MVLSDVFISYSRKDSMFVDSLNKELTKAEKDVWVDWEDIPYSSKWWDEISKAIEGATTFICILTPDYFNSRTCVDELFFAENLNKKIIPVLHKEFDPRFTSSSSIAKINWLPFRENDNFISSFNCLLATINQDLEWAKFHTRLLVRAIEWSSKKNDNSYHLFGKDLEEAQSFAKLGSNKIPPLNTLQNNYIEASQSGATRLQRKQLRGFYLAASIYSFAEIFVIYFWTEQDISEFGMIKLSWVWLPALSFAIAGFTIGRNSIKRSVVVMVAIMILFFLFFEFFWPDL